MAQAVHFLVRMAEARPAPRPARLRPAIVVAAALMLLWVAAYWRLGDVSADLFQISRSGPRAIALYLAGDYGGAARAYRAGLRGALPVPYVADPTGYWALRAGHADEAERRARTTLGLVPGAIEPLVTLGEVALDRNRATDAARSFAAVLRRQPDHVDALYLRAVTAARTDQPGLAIEALNRALRSASAGRRDTILYRIMELAGDLGAPANGARPLALLAHLHRYLRIFDDRHGTIAMDYARGAIAAGDRPADAYLTLGIVHDKRGEYEAARTAMRRAVEVDPRHADALWWLAVEAGKTGDALAEYQMITAAFDAAPTDPFYLEDLQRVLLDRLGDPAGLMRLLQRAVAANDTNVEAHARLASLAARLGDQARARVHRQRTAALGAREVEP